MIVRTDEAKEEEGYDGKHHIVIEGLNAILAGLPVDPKIEPTSSLLPEPTTVKFHSKPSMDMLCRQLAPTVGTDGSDYCQNRSGFLVHVA